MTFTIDNDNNIAAFAAGEQVEAGDGVQQFTSPASLDKIILASEKPSDRLVEIWNSFAGVAPFDDLKPVKQFTDRKTGVARVWKAIQRLEPTPKKDEPTAEKKAPKPNVAKQEKAAAEPKVPREGTAKAKVIAMISQKGGATLPEIMAATGWQKHTVRGFMSTLPKRTGLVITSTRRESDKARVYEVK